MAKKVKIEAIRPGNILMLEIKAAGTSDDERLLRFTVPGCTDPFGDAVNFSIKRADGEKFVKEEGKVTAADL